MGGTALADLGARAPGDLTAPLLSISGGLVGGTIVGTVTTWLLAATVFYWFAPLAYSMSDHLPRKDPAFRAIFAGGGVALGIVWWFGTFNHTASITIPWVGAVILLLTGAAITGSLVLWYLSSVHDWNLSNPHGPAFEMVALRNPDKDARAELETSFERYGAGIPLLALAMILGAPAVFAGVVILVLILGTCLAPA